MGQLPLWFVEILKESPMAGLCFAVMYLGYLALSKSHNAHLESKDKEIERLVKERTSCRSSS